MIINESKSLNEIVRKPLTLALALGSSCLTTDSLFVVVVVVVVVIAVVVVVDAVVVDFSLRELYSLSGNENSTQSFGNGTVSFSSLRRRRKQK
jgi:hypothetical protein